MKYAPLSWIQIGRVITPSTNKIRILLNRIPSDKESCAAQVYIGSAQMPASDIQDYLKSKMTFSNRQRECLEIIASSSQYTSQKGNFAINAQKLSHIFSLSGDISIEVSGIGKIIPSAHHARLIAKIGETEEAEPAIYFAVEDPEGETLENPIIIGTTEARVIDDVFNLFPLKPTLLPSETRVLLETSPLPLEALAEEEPQNTLHALAQIGIDLSCMREVSKKPSIEPQIILRTIIHESADGSLALRMHLVTEIKHNDQCQEVEIPAKGDLVPVFPFSTGSNHNIQVICLDRPSKKEKEARDMLLDMGATPSNSHRGFVCHGEKALTLLNRLSEGDEVPDWLEIDSEDLPEKIELEDKPKLVITEDGGLMNLVASMDFGSNLSNIDIKLNSILNAHKNGSTSFYHDDNFLIHFPVEIIPAVQYLCHSLDFETSSMQRKISFPELAILSSTLKGKITLVCPPHIQEQIDILTEGSSEFDRCLPKQLKTTLRPYQLDALGWLSNLDRIGLGRLLADDMGLGKTLMLLSMLAKVKENRETHLPNLIVAPTSVIDVWISEAKKHFSDLSTYKWHGADRHEDIDKAKESDLVITSFALLRRDQEILTKDFRFRYLIIDEAQHIKNAKTESWKAANTINAEQTVALSGTPIENRLEDLWSIFQLVVPGLLKSESYFAKHYTQPIAKGNTEKLQELKARIQPLMLRRRKNDVEKDLPEKIENILRCHMEPEQQSIYNNVLASAYSELKNMLSEGGDNKARMPLLAALTRLRQVCCDPALITGTRDPHQSAKRKLLASVIKDCIEMGRKMIIYSQFVEMQHIIHDLLKELNINNALWLHGGTRNRGDVVNAFQDPNGPPVIVVSLKAGGTGVTLTEADTVIHYDPWWNPAVEDQATDRAHRIGQKKTVHVIKLICENSIEEQMLQMCNRKRKAASSILENDGAAPKSLSMDEIKNIFQQEIDRNLG